MKRTIIALALTLCLICLSGCGAKQADTTTAGTDGPASLSFSSAVDFGTIQALDGKQVTIVGYMATLSPIDGTYIYLMNMPYQSCPFCKPNTSQLANTMAVYAKGGSTFAYTDQAIRVTGTMDVSDYTDAFGYEYNYRIKDATYEIIDLSTISSDYALWYSIASDGIVADVSAMFDYLYFVCQWTEYQATGTDESGNEVTYWLYPGDVTGYFESDSVYGYKTQRSEDYFPALIRRVRAISDTELTDLVSILEKAKALETYAISEFNAENYVYNETDDKFTLNNSQDLSDQFYAVYAEFSQWLAKWEL